MITNIVIAFFFIFLLANINFFLKKFSFGLDKETVNEKHKSLLRQDSTVPLSGSIFFLPIITIFFLNLDNLFIIVCSLLFVLGFFADLKIVTSYKKRLLVQFFLIFIMFYLSPDILINTRIEIVDNLMNYTLTRILLCTFFFMVLINGFNFIDGANCLCPLNLLIITIFTILIIETLNIRYMNSELLILIIALSIFVLFNFFGKNFLGDGAVYGLSFLLGYILLKVSLIDNSVSPYFIANLLWYPAFENLFSILRRSISKKNNYLPDNDHLHQLIFKFFKKKNISKKNSLLSSFVGLLINSILLIGYLIGINFYNHTMIQLVLIAFGIFLYLISYFFLRSKN